jgi:hypothetical protein
MGIRGGHAFGPMPLLKAGHINPELTVIGDYMGRNALVNSGLIH